MVWTSSLENRPDFVKAIGMISIENANLELALADLLAAALRVSREVAHAIYFTPRSATLRIDILIEACKERLRPRVDPKSTLEKRRKNALNSIERLAKLSKGVSQRRHDVMHDAWGVAGKKQKGSVVRSKIRGALSRDATPIKLSELHNLIKDIRTIIDQVDDLTQQLNAGPASMIDLVNPATKSELSTSIDI